MQRINVIGTSCSGKSTFCKRLAEITNLPHIELDALHFEAGWIEVPNDVFRNKIAAAIEGEAWIVDGNYSIARDLIWPIADTIIWLDYRFSRVLWQSIRRTLRRSLFGIPCCNGNRESFRRALSRDSIILWVIKTHKSRRERFQKLLPELTLSTTEVIVFRTPRAAEKWLQNQFEKLPLKEPRTEQYSAQ